MRYQKVTTPEAVAALWKSRAGDAKVEVYDPGRGAAWYLAKMFSYEDTRYDLAGLDYFTRSPGSGRPSVQ